MELSEIKSKLQQLRGKKEQVQNDLDSYKIKLRSSYRELEKHEQAKEVIRAVGIKTQQQLQYHISDITTLALEAVFPEPYKLEVEFIQRRNKTECDIYFTKNGNRVDPLTASGGGAVDVASFALRIASYSLNKRNSRNVIILDEPMKYVSEDLVDKASQMLKEVSEKLGIQFIIITHEQKLAAYADKTFLVKQRKGVSYVTTI